MTQQPKKHTLGVLGLGEGRSILSAAQSSTHWEIGQICDLSESLCQTRVQEFSLPGYTLDYAEMLADPTIDTIAIFTPDPLHGRHVVQAFEAGKHVICTKPFLDDLAWGPQLLQAARKRGCQLMVGQSSRFVESMLRQRADYEAGKFGDLVSLEAHYYHDHRDYMKNKWGPEFAPKMNWVYLGLSHPVDLVRWYLPDIAEVFGYGTLSPFAGEMGLTRPDVLHFVLKAADGQVARVSGVYGLPEQHMGRESLKSCTLRGTRGSSTSDYPQLRYFRQLDHQEPESIEFPELNDYYYRFGGYQHHAGEFQNYLDHFARSLDAGEPAQPDLLDGLRTVTVMRAMELSLSEHRPVTIEEVCQLHDLNALR